MLKRPKSGQMRIACCEPCQIDYGEEVFQGTIWNVSVLGVYLVLHHALETGRTLSLNFRLPEDSEPVRVQGRVAWKNPASVRRGIGQRAFDLPPGFGIEFIDLKAEDRLRIQERVQSTYPDRRKKPRPGNDPTLKLAQYSPK